MQLMIFGLSINCLFFARYKLQNQANSTAKTRDQNTILYSCWTKKSEKIFKLDYR